MKSILLPLILCVVSLMLSRTVYVIHAQTEVEVTPESTMTPTPTVDPQQATQISPTPTFSPPSSDVVILAGPIPDEEQFANVQRQYLSLLEQYRIQEQTYKIAREQYYQLNTLASQELVLREGKSLLTIRANVLLTYVQMIEWKLSQTRGIPLENKNSHLVTIGLLREQIQIHKSNIQASSDRLFFDDELRNFSQIYQTVQSQSYYALSLMKVGNMQSAYDKLLVVRDAVKADTDQRELSTSIRAEKQRGFDEIDRRLQRINTDMEPIKTDIYTGRRGFSVGHLSDLSKALSSPYSQMSQTRSLLQEIRK